LLRPEQWYKNLLVFLAALFSHNASNFPLYPRLAAGFLLLCLVSGSSYILNDIKDIDVDRAHPEKARRPLASGSVTVRTAFLVLGAVLVPALLLSYWLDVFFAISCTALFLLNVTYTFWLKRVVIADVLSIAAGFVVRGIAGGNIIPVPPSSWFVYGIFFAALLLALGKRSVELRTLESAGSHRAVLESYSHDVLFFGMAIASTLVIIFYTLYVTLGPPQGVSLLATVPVVVFMVYRYFYLVSNGEGRHERAEALFYDPPMMAAGAVLLGLIVILLYILPPLS
jgi:4-hydroxybenzoate polyprenyltransferase